MATLAQLKNELSEIIDAAKAGHCTPAQAARLDTIKADIEAAKHDQRVEDGERLIKAMIAAGPVKEGGLGSALAPLLPSPADAKALFDAAATGQTRKVTATIGYKVAPAGLTTTPGDPEPTIVPFAHQATRILGLFNVDTMTGPTIELLKHTSSTGAAAVVARGGLKPELGLDFTPTTLPARKIAVQTAVPDELLKDFAAFYTYLRVELQRSVIDAENNQILNGDGAGENFTGLLNTSGIMTRARGTDTALDALDMAITDLATGTAYTQPDALIMHPTNWSAIRRTKDTNGQYIVAPDPTGTGTQSLWGVPVVLTTTIAAGTALLGNFREAVAAYVREPLNISAGVNADDFISNLTRFRCEERLAVGARRPAALLKVTGL